MPGVRYRKPDIVATGGGVTRDAACGYGTGIASARAAVLSNDACVVPPRYVRMSGTSMATPHVAGICALLLEASRGRGLTPASQARAVRQAVVGSASAIKGTPVAACGAGLVDATAALELLTRRARTVVPA